MKRLAEVAADLASGRTTSRALVEAAYARIDDPAGEGKRTFIRVNRSRALAEAEASDTLRKAGIVPSPLAGIPVSVKDLCDIAGETTLAGSIALKDAPPAKADAPVVARLRAAGAVIVGTTNMTEFAFGGLGHNPHYGTPKSPWDRKTGRIPGGSSSGAGVSVADGMVFAALGTDTAGSVRVPAAMCGVTGFKPTARRVPIAGIVPLAATLDSVGPLAPSVACCALLDSVFAAEAFSGVEPFALAGLRCAVPQTYVLDNLDKEVAQSFKAALSKLSAAGARIIEAPLKELADIPGVVRQGAFTGSEAYAWHKTLVERAGDKYDQVIVKRVRRGAQVTAAEYIDILKARANLIARANRATIGFDVLLAPTAPIIPVPIADITDNEENWLRYAMLTIRNTVVANILDRCSLSIPCHKPGEAPVGLMLIGETMADKRLLSIGMAIEAALASAA